MTQETIRLKAIKAVSPTVVETLRLCKLRAGLSRVAGINRYVLGNPKAWLGSAYHAVLESVSYGQDNDVDTRARVLWNAAIEQKYERTRNHPLDKRFGSPETWPSYHMVSAMALVRARELAVSAAVENSRSSDVHASNTIWREQMFSAAHGKLIGRPDVVLPDEVVDFKTGNVFEDKHPDQVKTAYVRQLRLYAYLVKETLGWWPRRGILLPMVGSPVVVEMGPGECELEAADAIRFLDEYNKTLARIVVATKLASPSTANCRWCQYQLYCPGFWGAVGPQWNSDFPSAVIEGKVISPVKPIYGGSALSISLKVEKGTISPEKAITLFPLDPSVHKDLLQMKEGDSVRVIGLWQRADNSIVPTLRTIISRISELPRIERAI